MFLKILALTIFTAVADFFLKKASEQASWYDSRYFVLGLAMYMGTAFFWVHIYANSRFSLSTSLYSIMGMLMFVGIGVFYFGERLSVTEVTGVLFGVASMILLSRFV